MVFRLQLNLALRDNYVFCDLKAPLHLSISNPCGTSARITGSIIRGLKGNTLIDLDNVIDLKTKSFRIKETPVIPTKKPVVPDKKVAEKIVEKVVEDKVEKDKRNITKDKAPVSKKEAPVDKVKTKTTTNVKSENKK